MSAKSAKSAKLLASALISALICTLVWGCTSLPDEGGVSPRQRIDAKGDVESTQKTTKSESGVQVEEGGARDVSTIKYGLDEGTRKVLSSASTQIIGVGAKVFASGFVFFAGLAVLMFMADSPGGLKVKAFGALAGLATALGGPVLVWMLL